MAFDLASLDAPFASLKTYDWGADAGFFKTIDDAVIAAHADASLRRDIEKRFSALLGDGTSRAAKEYICRKLSMIGTASSVPALAALLPHKDHSHMARFALERIGGPEAADALRKAFASLDGDLKLGMMASLAARRDTASVPLFAPLLKADEKTAVAAAKALGMIQDAASSQALASAAAAASGKAAAAITDARLACAEAMLAEGKRSEAMAVYRQLEASAAGKPGEKAAAIAAKRGIVACLDTTQ
jgi:hypothetical protein